MNFDIDIVIPLFNKSHFTKVCLESLLENTSRPSHLVCIDNASTDDTVEILSKLIPRFKSQGWRVELIKNDTNLGFGRAMNQGCVQGKSKYLGLLNNDTWLSKNWDIGLLSAIEKLNAGMISPYYYEGPFDLDFLPTRAMNFTKRNQGKKRIFWGGPFMLLKRQIFEEIGMFDERYFVGFEDTDLKYRFLRNKISFFQVGDSFIWHFGKGTRGDMSELDKQGLELFMNKWGFDPRHQDNTYWTKIIKRFRRIKEDFGYF